MRDKDNDRVDWTEVRQNKKRMSERSKKSKRGRRG